MSIHSPVSHPAGRLAALGLAAVLAACASPVPPQSLVKAQQAYDAASGDPEVASNAPVYLYEAKKALDLAEKTWKADEEDPKVEHHAYLAHKRVEIARELAVKRGAEDQARALARERDQTVLEARSRQVDLARVAVDQARSREEEAQAREAEARRLAEAETQRALEAAAAAEAEAQKAAELRKQLAELQARKTERGMVITLGDVLFDFNRAVLRTGAQQNLYRLVTFLRENPDRDVLIEGHTDSVGSETYNQGLSEQRAEAVRGFLTQNGIDAIRTAASGFGETRPVASNESDAGRQQNRRVEIVILDPGKKAAQEVQR